MIHYPEKRKEVHKLLFRVKEVADLSGVSVRTLHYYDEIGLLVPDTISESGYRLYSEEDLEKLQQILFYRELGFPLMKIKEIISSSTFDRKTALEKQRDMLYNKRKQLDRLIETIEMTIKEMKGEVQMTHKQKFQGFDFSHNPYEDEARKRWGDKAVDKSNAKLNPMSKDEQQALGEQMNDIYRKLATLRHGAPDSPEAQEAIGEWYHCLGKFGTYPPEAFKNLGQMYVDDERFTKNIDQFGEGLALFMRDAMAIYADRMAKN